MFAVEECELFVFVPNIVQYEYDSEELKAFATEKNISEDLHDYLELYKGMSFKDIPEARQCNRLYALGKKIKLTVVKSDMSKLRFTCNEGECPFVCHISGDAHTPGVRIKTLNDNHTCWPTFDNPVVDYSIIAQYFKKKLQENPKFKIKEMRASLHNAFKLKASQGKCKRAKRMVLETLEGDFTDGYNKLEAYAIELKESIPGNDVVINLSKEAVAQGKRKFLRRNLHL
ncbi:hypothetical protein KY290_018512 [Solanum tuberosum]|uniref:Transposase MuDR plant domain-containing protein n=1 Tax=Solanum tuberosum TaxID=4113 RepID=A0ABQ7VEI0_SOLTU|nr:hypothetical protein KY289_017630 [Solanum tuberosum]KAH0762439.1 hypothetical protein KY290_018512 [Solanum tuberosum]